MNSTDRVFDNSLQRLGFYFQIGALVVNMVAVFALAWLVHTDRKRDTWRTEGRELSSETHNEVRAVHELLKRNVASSGSIPCTCPPPMRR